MKSFKVLKKQYVSRDCFVCGTTCESGLKARFYEVEGDKIIGIVTPESVHQSYPGRVHGGIISALLDEVMGRSVHIQEPTSWGVTAEMTVRFKKPVPYGQTIYLVGEVATQTKRKYETNGYIVLQNGDIAASATGKYVKLKEEAITSANLEDVNFYEENHILEINLPTNTISQSIIFNC